MLRTGRILKAAAVILVAAGAFLLVPASQAQTYRAADEAASRGLVNKARADVGLGALKDNAGLDQVARAQAVRMAQANQLFHNPHLVADVAAAGVKWEWLGENVACGFSVAGVHQDFMSSPEHHHNIVLPNYDAIGVGIVEGKNGTIWVAHVFAKLATSAPKAAAPKTTVTTRPASAPAKPVAAPATVRPAATRIPTRVAGKVVTRSESDPNPNALQHGVVTPKPLP